MFRPIAMVVPDSTLIAEIILFGEGFGNCKVGHPLASDYFPAVIILRLAEPQRASQSASPARHTDDCP